MKNQEKTPLLDAITAFCDTRPAYFRIPGHRLERGVSQRLAEKIGTKVFAYDVTETPFTDDLHHAQTSIKEAQELLAQLYAADRSFFLVNGSTCGNEVMILSAALAGEEILIARNAHKSAMMGLIISGAKPIYLKPEVFEEYGISGGITPQAAEQAFCEHPGCKALFVVSPSYYGVTSPIKELAEVCHRHHAMLLVDEAHGGHVYFHEALPMGAIEQGADLCVQSMHKVTGAMTQSSVLHVRSDLVDMTRVTANLQLVQSTSPSYLLMTSLDCARYELAMHGKEMMEHALGLAAYARERIRKLEGFRCMGQEAVGVAGIAQADSTRLVISAAELGLTGFDLEALLFENYAVNMELADYENVLAIVTYANTKEDIDRLLSACEDIAQQYKNHKTKNDASVRNKKATIVLPPVPQQIMTPREAYFAKTITVPWKESVGEISAEMIAPYPPGIPILYPGERISQQVWSYLEQFRIEQRPMHGADDGRLERIKIIRQG